jgi:serine/threonine protein kinase
MTQEFSVAWPELSRYLDQVLELDGEARQEFLRDLDTREPAISAQIRAALIDLEDLDARNFLTRGGAAPTPSATLAGQALGAYTLDRQIGHGGMGTVWLAHRHDGRYEGRVAIKLLNSAYVGHPWEQRFVREGSVLARLQHPNIAHLIDAGVGTGSQPYLVLEYVEGVRIDQYCEAHDLDIDNRIRLFLDVLAAVAHAHTNLIVHRDLKPSNILVTNDGVVKLLDFGVAALLTAANEATSDALTRNVAVGLTPEYAAPEQLLREPITTATDVYALGLVLFVLLAGRHPASPEGKTAAELMRMTLDTEPPRASDIATDIPRGRVLRGDLDNIIAMTLRKNPAERYTTVEMFAQDLRRYLALEPVVARPSSLGYRAGKFVRRHRGSIAASAAVVMILIAAVVTTTSGMIEARHQRDVAQYQSRRAESSSAFMQTLLLSEGGGPQAHPLTYIERIELGVDLLHKQYRDDPPFMGRMLVELAGFLRDDNEIARANALYDEAERIGREHNDPELIAFTQCNRAYGEASAGTREGVLERVLEGQHLLDGMPDADDVLRSNCMMAEARFHQRGNDDVRAEEIMKAALKLLEDTNNTHTQSYVSQLSDLGSIYLARNQPAEVLRIARLGGEIHEKNGRGATSARLVARQNEAVALTAMGEVKAAFEQRKVIMQRVAELETPGQEPFAYPVNYATALLRMNQPTEALQAMDGVVERARKADNPFVLTNTQIVKGWALLDLGRIDEAEQLLTEADTLASGGRNRAAMAQAEALRARLDLARKDPAAAKRHSDAALEAAGYRTEKPVRPLARTLIIAAEVAMAQNATAEAAIYAKDALTIGEAVAQGPDTSADVGEALLWLGKVALAKGDKAQAKPMLERAVRSLTNGIGADNALTQEAQALLSSL